MGAQGVSLWILGMDSGMQLAIPIAPGAIHAGCVEAELCFAIRSDGNHTALATQGLQLTMYDLLAGFMVAEDFRKGSLGSMAKKCNRLLQIVAKFSTTGSIMLFVMGLVLWGVAIVIHSI